MKICPNCNANVEDGMTFCPNCGAPQEMNSSQDYSANMQPDINPAVQAGTPVAGPVYQSTPYYDQQMYGMQMMDQEVSLGDWVLSTFLSWIPLVGFIMLIIWAASSDTKPSKKNWARARLIWMGVAYVLSFLIFTLFWGAIATLINY